MGRLKTLKPRIGILQPRLKPPPKRADQELLTHAHKMFRKAVGDRAGWRCEHVDSNGIRCYKAQPDFVMYADHKIERKDGGSLYNPDNGQLFCAEHHTLKTNRERNERNSRKY